MKMYVGVIKFITSSVLVAMTISACTSKEKKVAETIKSEMFKTLYDFESYQPIETKIDTLRRDKYGDTLIFDDVMLMAAAYDKFKKEKENFDEQVEIAEIYRPTYYSSSTSDNKFYAARDKMKEALDGMKFYNAIMDSLNTEIRTKEKKCDNNQYGWFVTHKFRCKTKGGNSTIGTYYYFMDIDCKRIIRRFDEDDMTLEKYHKNIDAALELDDEETKKNNDSKEL